MSPLFGGWPVFWTWDGHDEMDQDYEGGRYNQRQRPPIRWSVP